MYLIVAEPILKADLAISVLTADENSDPALVCKPGMARTSALPPAPNAEQRQQIRNSAVVPVLPHSIIG